MNKVFLWVFICMSGVAFAANEALLKKVETGDLKSLNEAFALHAKSDGGNAEDIDIAIGKSIAKSPKNFLTALKNNRADVARLSATVGNLGPDYVDDFKSQKLELQRRLTAIQSVHDQSLKGVRAECEAQIKKQIQKIPVE